MAKNHLLGISFEGTKDTNMVEFSFSGGGLFRTKYLPAPRRDRALFGMGYCIFTSGGVRVFMGQIIKKCRGRNKV